MNPVAPTVEISAVMPAYNEEANLEQSVGRMASALQTFTRGFEIIVVDDGSQDGTATVLERLKGTYPTLRVIRHPTNRGYGAALRSGFDAAHFSWVFLMDADNSSWPGRPTPTSWPGTASIVATPCFAGSTRGRSSRWFGSYSAGWYAM